MADARDLVDEMNTLLCILFAVLSYTLLNIGLVLEKKGASELPPIELAGPRQSAKNFLRNRVWLVGFILTNVQIVPFFAAVSLGPISLVSPMIGVGLLVLIAFSVGYLDERINRPMWIGIGLTLVALVIIGATSGASGPMPGWSDTLDVLSRTGTLAYLGGLVVAAIVPVLVARSLHFKLADVLFGISSGVSASVGMLSAKFMMAGFDAQDLDLTLRRWQVYLFAVLVLAGNFGSLVLQQFGFQKGKAVVLAPIFTALIIVVPAVTGVVLFGEWQGSSTAMVVLKLTAMTVLLAGVSTLSYYSASEGAGRSS